MKMKMLSAVLATSMLSVSAFASPVPSEKLASYVEAARFALSQVQLNCTFNPAGDQWVGGGLDAIIAQSTSADLNESGAQPVLTFTYNSDYQVAVTAITTSADYKSIVAIDYSQYQPSSQQVNLGTIVNPNIVTQIVKTNVISASCK